MKTRRLALAAMALVLLSALPAAGQDNPGPLSFEQLRRHTLARFSYGMTLQDFDRIQTEAQLDAWFERQLSAPRAIAPRRAAWIEENLNEGHPESAYPPEAWELTELEQKQLYLAITSDHQLREVMTYFWESHFSTNAPTVYGGKAQSESGAPVVAGVLALGYLWQENDTYRRHALSTFQELLHESFETATMRIYLNVTAMYDGEANEDYARELLELHTLGTNNGAGEPSYTSFDVDHVAQLMTGQGVRRLTGEAIFNPAGYQPPPAGTTLIFDNPDNPHLETYVVIDDAGTGDNARLVLDHLVNQVQTKRYICQRMIEFFVGEPVALDSQLMTDCVAAWDAGAGGGDIKEILRAIRSSPEFLDAALGQRRVKSPLEYVVSQARLFEGSVHGARYQQANSLSQASAFLRTSGQPLFLHASPNGYPISSQEQVSTGAHYARYQLASSLGSAVDPSQGHPPSKAAAFELAFDLRKNTLGRIDADPLLDVAASAEVAAWLVQHALGSWGGTLEETQVELLLQQDGAGLASPWDPSAADALERVELACAYLAALPQSSEK